MTAFTESRERDLTTAISAVCASTDVSGAAAGLAHALSRGDGGLTFRAVLSRGGWYRPGARVCGDARPHGRHAKGRKRKAVMQRCEAEEHDGAGARLTGGCSGSGGVSLIWKTRRGVRLTDKFHGISSTAARKSLGTVLSSNGFCRQFG